MICPSTISLNSNQPVMISLVKNIREMKKLNRKHNLINLAKINLQSKIKAVEFVLQISQTMQLIAHSRTLNSTWNLNLMNSNHSKMQKAKEFHMIEVIQEIIKIVKKPHTSDIKMNMNLWDTWQVYCAKDLNSLNINNSQ